MLLEQMGTALHLYSKRIIDICTVESTKDDKWLDKFEPQGLVCGRPTAECMDGTRKDIIAKIDEWCDDLDTSSNILWISGFLESTIFPES